MGCMEWGQRIGIRCPGFRKKKLKEYCGHDKIEPCMTDVEQLKTKDFQKKSLTDNRDTRAYEDF